MKEQLSQSEEEKKHIEWARDLASRLDVQFDETAAHFIIPIYDEQGAQRGEEIIPAWRTIPFKDKNTTRQIPVEEAIAAMKKHPHLNFPEALKKELSP